jgi:hypothetical protein
MDKKLSWEDIRNSFSGLWVELVDCDWDWDDANPRSARVRNYSPDRKKLISKNNRDSVILFIGAGKFLSGKSLLGMYNESFSQAVGY